MRKGQTEGSLPTHDDHGRHRERLSGAGKDEPAARSKLALERNDRRLVSVDDKII